jgi:membrane fusion protein, heavy metal efflux system
MKATFMIFCTAVFFTACSNNRTEKATEEKTSAAEKHEEEESPFIEITPEQMKAVNIETDSIQQKNLSSAIKVNGVLTVPNQNKALVTSVINGVIKTLHVQPGDLVAKGQLIATIINPDVAPIQQQLQITNAQISMAEIEQKRQQELIAGNAAPLKNLQRVNTELATLRATRNGLQQQLRAMGLSSGGGNISTTLRVLAPISGTVSEVSAQIGSNVDASTPIAQIVNNSQLHLDIFIYEKDLGKVKDKQSISFSLTNLQGKVYNAEIYSVGSAFASETKTIPVHAIVKGDKMGLIDGMNITASISTGTITVPAVPTEAIVTNAGQDYIFIVSERTDSGPTKKDVVLFEKWPVIKGTVDAGFTEIITVNPLPANAKIVTKGAFFVLAKMTNKGEEE